MGLFDSGKKSLRAGRKRAWESLAQGSEATKQSFAEALPELLKGLEQLGLGYDQGLSEVNNIGAAARQRTIDRGDQLVGSVKQNMQSRGLASTTVGGNLERGVGYDTNLALGQIDDQLAQLRSGLRIGKGQAMYQGLSGLAQTYLNRGEQVYGEFEDSANVSLGMAANLAAADQSMFSSLAGLAGSAAGAAGMAMGGI